MTLRNLAIGWKIILACSGIVISAVLAFAVYLDHRQATEIEHSLQTRVQESGELATRSISNWLGGRLLLVESLRDNIAGDSSSDAVHALVKRRALTDRFLYSYLGTEGGAMYMVPDEDKLPAGYDPRIRPWYKTTKDANASVITEPYVDLTSGALVVTIAAPLTENNAFAGVVGADISLQAMVDLVRSVDLGGIGYAFLVSDQGTILIHPNKALTLKPIKEAVPDFSHPISGPTAGTLTRLDDNRMIAFIEVKGLPSVHWHLGLVIDRTAAFAPLQGFRISIAIMTALLLAAIIGLVGYIIHRLVSKPVIAMSHVMSELSQGSLDVHVPYSDRADEIGQMAGSVLHFQQQLTRVRQMEQEKLEQIVRSERHRKSALTKLVSSLENTVEQVTKELASAADDMQNSSSQMSSAAVMTSEKAATVSAAAEQTSVNVQTVASATDQLSASSSDIGRQVGLSREIAQQADERAKDTAAAVQALSDDVGKIGDVVRLITDIASQTNLLALNATIEAARAGDAGKGFAVVANEVKSLANQTARATEQISASIESVQNRTSSAVEAIEGITSVIARMSEISVSVALAVEQQDAATAEIAKSVDQTSQGTQDVSRSIADVEQAASDTSRVAGHIAEASGALSLHADRLKKEITRFVAQVSADKENIRLLEWSPEMATGQAAIDAHHQEIIAELNCFAGEMLHGDGISAAGKMLEKMRSDMAAHFKEEEQHMRKQNYAGLNAHHLKHAEFLGHLKELGANIENGKTGAVAAFFDYTAEWLCQHIEYEDRPFILSLQGRAA